jgi:murein DD-endopeptidase MepM/ murein hydrolase activator NlpD
VTYPFLAAIFACSAVLLVVLVGFLVIGRTRWRAHRRKVFRLYAVWFGAYAIFIAFGTGPNDLASYPPARSSPYKLPWRAGVSRFVAQGNRSFTSHRDAQLHAWDFWMALGTEVLAAREGDVVAVEDGWDGIGLASNFVTVEHDDGTRAVYAHVRRHSAVVNVGQHVRQGELLTLSGMVGQTVFPHLHFVVQNRDGSASVPVSFADVPNGVPLAGRIYESQNVEAR